MENNISIMPNYKFGYVAERHYNRVYELNEVKCRSTFLHIFRRTGVLTGD